MDKDIIDLFDEPYVEPTLTPEQERQKLAEINRDAQEEYAQVWAPYDRQVAREMHEAEISFARFEEERYHETLG